VWGFEGGEEALAEVLCFFEEDVVAGEDVGGEEAT
jgi:hypothetical protein